MQTCIWVQKGIALEQILSKEYFTQLNIVFFKDIKEVISQSSQFQNILVFRASLLLDNNTICQIKNFKAAALVSTGSDQVDVLTLQQQAIPFFHFPGKNARAVRDYVVQALLLLFEKTKVQKIAVIGKGYVGTLLTKFLHHAQIPYRWYDPFLEENDSHQAKDVAQLSDCSVFSFHVPLHEHPPHATFQMLQENYFYTKEFPFVIQTSRGKIWQPQFYQKMLLENKIWAQDVYLLEPPLPHWLLPLSTPHIAGYSTKGRLQALQLVMQKIFDLLNVDVPFLSLPASATWSLLEESKLLKANPKSFGSRRDHFPWRKELQEYSPKEQLQFKKDFSFLKNQEHMFKAVFNT